MQVWNITVADAEIAADSIGVEVDARPVNGKSIRVKAYPRKDIHTGIRTDPYVRRSPDGRRLHALCTHGFEDLFVAFFEAGATRIKSPLGDWRSLEEFRHDVPRINASNVGSPYRPVALVDTCDHAAKVGG